MLKHGILFVLASSLLLSHQVAVVDSQSWCLPILTTYQARADCTDVLAGRFRCNYPGIPGQGDLKYFIEEYERCMTTHGGTSPSYQYDDGHCATRPNDPVFMFRGQRI
ncbi:MAG: hypothetical protein JOS17DRAFT_768520 [Linnemannia elongata]|nr:MAG: hypothetical protein JOS17DRAFT_768520 [Linnemannia elongata]